MKNNPFLLSLDDDWTIEGMEPYEGLNAKAYEPSYVPKNPVKARVPGIVQNALLGAQRPRYDHQQRQIGAANQALQVRLHELGRDGRRVDELIPTHAAALRFGGCTRPTR